MTELRGIYTLWLREVKRYLRDRVRILSSFVAPVLWLIIFGTGIRFSGVTIGSLTYQQYLFPGIIGQSLLFTSMFMGISVIWDREFGFMKEILVSPISRVSTFLGKMLGGSTDAVIQGTIVFWLGTILGYVGTIGVATNPLAFLVALPIMVLITFGLVSLGLTIASFMESLESYGVVQSFINLPLFFLSGALFPIGSGQVPEWLLIASRLNPLTYAVDSLRTIVLGDSWTPLNPLYINILIVVLFDAAMIILGTFALSRRK